MRHAAAAVVALLVAAPALARPPELVRWQDAAAHVGQVITVEGPVASARVAGGACMLEFAPADPSALRVVLMLGLFSAPVAPERVYAGHRIRASGRVQTFQGRPEMIIRRADQIEVMDEASTTTTLAASPKPPAAAPAQPMPPSTVPPSTVPDTGPSGGAVGSGRTELCARARDRVDTARRELATRAEEAARCLRAGTSRCQQERDAVTLALQTLPAREVEADSACE